MTAAATPLTLGAATPAASATCADAGGVSVVVDFKGLGGGAQSHCDAAGGGKTAWSLFERSGFDLETVQRTPGFVCRVNGLPGQDSDPCVNTPPANAYWGLWWSNGKTGKWTYSTLGAASLTVPAGGSVALAWDAVEGQSAPGVAPPRHAAAPEPSPSPSPSATPTKKPTPKPTPTTNPSPAEPTPTPSATPTATPTPAASESPAPSPLPAGSAVPTPTPTPTPSASETPTDVVETAAPVEPDDGGVPPWVPVAVLVALFGGAAVVLVLRRRPGA